MVNRKFSLATFAFVPNEVLLTLPLHHPLTSLPTPGQLVHQPRSRLQALQQERDLAYAMTVRMGPGLDACSPAPTRTCTCVKPLLAAAGRLPYAA